eukprot:300728_1
MMLAFLLYPRAFFFNYMLPFFFVSIPMVALTFNFIPHRPHSSTDKYKSSKTTYLFPNNYGILTVLFLYQNYHNVHHFWPYLPFYYYSSVWEKHKKKLKENGASDQLLFSSAQ